MELFLDTANVDEIREAAALGVISGVTTNPSLIAREGRDFTQVVREITGLVDGPVSAEVISTEAEAMVAEAEELSQIHPNVVIKIPMILEGLKAVSMLEPRGIRTNVTLVFSANQALLAALAGASFVSPFVGRLDDAGHDGMEVVRDTVDIFDLYELPTRVIAASIRHPLHVLAAAKAGAHIATVPYQVLMQMAGHPLTDVGLRKFLDDWARLKKR
ncbi:fructose-6-phosphate aldolase [Candidatus Desulforudis audaxviator]|uniref:Probable transaldolase n=1 Tax=Desulforudis audaxviator (strain MP104C) TaxID=477974 RepID=TAL_DESAP|nr:fructose-6-phosphate aldolase [Candidatus Desulforudis audaxviator]B1I6H9.1 RecName: Full=Probable transaldolase [Candidatus Desulforudis audaxviator MP104C]ACA60661.1 putative transaldolase [Candidatus Desulforudis audaxviator MP104C]AZK60744.1 Transaldolase [Candidatus Desulforudis audaxviator]